jgi:hypothetical protein
MTLIALTTCCLLLGIDGKTLRRWLAQAHLPVEAHPNVRLHTAFVSFKHHDAPPQRGACKNEYYIHYPTLLGVFRRNAPLTSLLPAPLL